jgi:hypothetical protein
MEFVKWSKIPRFNREWEITEKIDGTNAVLYWSDTHDGRFDTSSVLAQVGDLFLYAGSRNRWLHHGADNHGFAKWAQENAEDLATLGPGRHYGEWYGQGVQRGYGLNEKRFALFNTKWSAQFDMGLPKGVDSVPILTHAAGASLNADILESLAWLREYGSAIAPDYKNPEGIVIRHMQSGDRFKVTVEDDEIPRELNNV